MSQVFNPAFFFAWACGVGGKPFTEVKITPKGEKAIGPGLEIHRDSISSIVQNSLGFLADLVGEITAIL